MKNVLLVEPELSVNSYNDYSYLMDLFGKCMAMPYGLLTVAAYIPETYNKKLVDLRVPGISLQKADIKQADIIFLSGHELQKESIHQICNTCKNINPNATLILGGVYATLQYDDIVGFHCIIVGEIENFLHTFFNDYETGSLKPIYIIENKPKLQTCVAPCYNLIDINDYYMGIVQLGRGCPYDCDFCLIANLQGKNIRTKPHEVMERELNALYDTGFEGLVMFADDNYASHHCIEDHLLFLSEWQKEHNYPFMFFTQTDITLADNIEKMRLMRKANFHAVCIGLESPIPESFNMANKRQNQDRNLIDSVKKIQQQGIEVYGAMIVGLDGDRKGFSDLMYDFLKQAGIPHSMISILCVRPGMPIHKKLEKENRVTHQWDGSSARFGFPPLGHILKNMDKEDFYKEYARLILKLYDPVQYFERCLNYLNNFAVKSDRLSLKRRFVDFKNFLTIMDQIRNHPKYYKELKRFLIKVFLTKPLKIIIAIELGMSGFNSYMEMNEFHQIYKDSFNLIETDVVSDEYCDCILHP